MTVGRPQEGGGLVLTPIDLTQTLADMLTGAGGDLANNQAALTTWVTSLDDLKQGLQAGDHARAVASITALQQQLAGLQAANLVTPSLAWRVRRGLLWIEAQFSPAELPASGPSPTSGPAPTAGPTLPEVPSPTAAQTLAPDVTEAPATSGL
jgi:hypothetical protein